MPAGFTHILLAKGINEKTNHMIDDLEIILGEFQDYLQLGAISPDLPYSQQINPFNDEQEIADDFHWKSTNQVALSLLKKVKEMPSSEEKDMCFCFVLGMMSHISADGVIHPYVRDKVGPYKVSANEHRMLEMRLDVLFANETAGTEINCSKFQDELSNCLNSIDHISTKFADSINEVYGRNVESDDVIKWIKAMEALFEAAANEHNQYYAMFPGAKGYLYNNLEELIANKDNDLILRNSEAVDRESNFRGADTHFINDCIPQFYKVIKEIAIKAYNYAYGNGNFTEENLPAINLDTGRSIDNGQDGYNLDTPAVYWGL